MQYLPIFTDLTGKAVLLVGGGHVALRKARTLLNAGAVLTVVSHQFEAEFYAWQQQQKAHLIQGDFDAAQLAGHWLVLAATDDDGVNAAVHQAATARQIWVNTVDDQDKCEFIFPSIIDRSPILVAISSGGTAPVLVRRLREKLETLLPQHLGPLAELVGRFRTKVQQKLQGFAQRRQFWEKVFNSNIVSLVQTQQLGAAEAELQQALQDQQSNKGEVYVVGAGPGDPELLTLKALQLMQQADVVVYDYLVSEPIMQLVRRDAELICVGKKAGAHSVAQEHTNQLLIDLALAGKKVCRLKGGDPFIFGRGAEEIEVLLPHQIPFQVVPGITAAAGCAAYAGIPLTHRDYAQAVQFVTGHCQKDGKEPDWHSLSRANQTLVIYMGLMKSAHIQAQLLAAGRAADTPIAILENGTRPEQRVITGTLAQLADLIEQQQVQSPALLVIGEVVVLQHKLAWYGNRTQAAVFAQPLAALA
ncbi:MAG TPA: uroporphyrinogen-III C-methyltransferase [Rheinheimera sp.]|uniref:siroheme synthase CysG n=1 Tax=Rheinheimera sp. TaxID=1869214 RepID=UPI000ECEF340|nr:siroheme synthase CysG [Rheinheimera sp.]HCU65554.1 uroporphyrinogen-III C-methyltransferase [Rheinheimera sp.]